MVSLNPFPAPEMDWCAAGVRPVRTGLNDLCTMRRCTRRIPGHVRVCPDTRCTVSRAEFQTGLPSVAQRKNVTRVSITFTPDAPAAAAAARSSFYRVDGPYITFGLGRNGLYIENELPFLHVSRRAGEQSQLHKSRTAMIYLRLAQSPPKITQTIPHSRFHAKRLFTH